MTAPGSGRRAVTTLSERRGNELRRLAASQAAAYERAKLARARMARAAARAVDVDGVAIHEVASALGVSVGTAHRLVTEGRES